jgi:hypothetical protein
MVYYCSQFCSLSIIFRTRAHCFLAAFFPPCSWSTFFTVLLTVHNFSHSCSVSVVLNTPLSHFLCSCSLSAIFRIAHCPPFFIHMLNLPQFSYARSLSSIFQSMLTVPYFLHTRAQCLLIFVLKLIVRRFRIARCPKIFILALTVYHFCKLVLTVRHFLKYSNSLLSSLRSTYGTQCAKVLFSSFLKCFSILECNLGLFLNRPFLHRLQLILSLTLIL